MSRHIEFRTPIDDDLFEFSFGNPVHDGNIPSRFREVLGIRVDGETLILADEELVHSLHRALVEMRGFFRRPFADCVSFAALMNGLELPSKDFNPLLNTRTDVRIDIHDHTVADTLYLGVTLPEPDTYEYLHSVVPAHHDGTAQYVHKLGDNGPVCLTDLEDAMSMYACTVAHPVILD